MDRLVWEPESPPSGVAVAAAAAAAVIEDEPVTPLVSSEDILYLMAEDARVNERMRIP